MISRFTSMFRPQPFAQTNKFRSQRFAQFRKLIDATLKERGQCSILDIGGTHRYWSTYGADLPETVHITVVNLKHWGTIEDNRFTFIEGDACNMKGHADMSFDIVHSNSVIEHVGLWPKVAAMAREVQRLAPRYFIQTPNFWFPIEPHYRLPYFHLLPEPLRMSLLLRKKRGFVEKGKDIHHAMEGAQFAFLLNPTQMEFLFPDAEIAKEKFMGLTKSLTAIKH